MILRRLTAESSPDPAKGIVPAWEAVEANQSASAPEGWLITQPAHAALSGEMAAHFDPALFPGLGAEAVRAIALHDAGWGPYDAAVIQPLAAGKAAKAGAAPYSFIHSPAAESVAAWTGSVDVAAKDSPLGGLLVSLHFCAIAEFKLDSSSSREKTILQRFRKGEQARQETWRKKLGPAGDPQRVQPLLTALQLCDLLSLYLCCGLNGSVEFPQEIAGKPVRLRRTEFGATLAPSPFHGEHPFTVSGLRFPRSKDAPRAAVFSLMFR